jgi:hypothetical protein
LPDDGEDKLHLVVHDVLTPHIHESDAHFLRHVDSIVAVLNLLEHRGGLHVDAGERR